MIFGAFFLDFRKHLWDSELLVTRQSPSTNSPAQVTAEEKNDTIEEFDFFGFSPKIYWRDLQRTGLATIVVSAVLITVYFLTN